MLLLDLSHTSHTRAQTGIQRVGRALHRELGARACTVTWDPHADCWRGLEAWEQENLRATAPAAKRRGVWPLSAKLCGWISRLRKRDSALPPAGGLIVPELFSSDVARAFARLEVRGPRIALFHDAIALKFPEFTPPGTVARFPAYLQELLQFDGIAAVSEDSAATLRDYWRWLGVPRTPPVQAIPLGLEQVQPIVNGDDAPPARMRVLCVGTIEGRKNHLALLEACDALWRDGLDFELQLVGLARADTAAAALQKISALKAAGRPLIYDGPATDATLRAAYVRCGFTVYPSLIEGFGLPVIESLRHGKPCVCSGRGALGESARGGGCVMLDPIDAPALAGALRRLLSTSAELAALAAAARRRTFRTWRDYAGDLTAWMAGL